MDNTEWECMECGYLHEGRIPPHSCPDCGSVDAWEKVEYVEAWDDEDDEFEDDYEDEDDE
jgi:rubredoxin